MATGARRPSLAPNVVLIVGTAPTIPRIRSRVRFPPEDRSLPGLAEPDYDATISLGLPFEPEYSQYGEPGFTGGP